jgi:hypothetical protein
MKTRISAAIAPSSETVGAHQRDDEIDKQPHRNGKAQDEGKHAIAPSQPRQCACRQHERQKPAHAKRQIDQIKHDNLL